MKSTVEFLRNSDFFSILEEDELGKIAPYFKSRKFKAGEVILSENDPPDRFYLLKGRIGRNLEELRRHRGDPFGRAGHRKHFW
jgi:CRP-like cAMP-binding protein